MSEETRLYELGYLITPTTPEGEVGAQVEVLKGMITKAGGAIHSDGTPEFIDLAYTMEKDVASKKYKYSQGYFGWVKFTLAPEAMEDLKKALDGTLALIRYILVKTSVENTVVFKKPKVEAKREVFMSDEELAELADAAQTEGDASIDESVEEHEKLPELGDEELEPTASNEA